MVSRQQRTSTALASKTAQRSIKKPKRRSSIAVSYPPIIVSHDIIVASQPIVAASMSAIAAATYHRRVDVCHRRFATYHRRVDVCHRRGNLSSPRRCLPSPLRYSAARRSAISRTIYNKFRPNGYSSF